MATKASATTSVGIQATAIGTGMGLKMAPDPEHGEDQQDEDQPHHGLEFLSMTTPQGCATAAISPSSEDMLWLSTMRWME